MLYVPKKQNALHREGDGLGGQGEAIKHVVPQHAVAHEDCLSERPSPSGLVVHKREDGKAGSPPQLNKLLHYPAVNERNKPKAEW
jgi:hypothetical protein